MRRGLGLALVLALGAPVAAGGVSVVQKDIALSAREISIRVGDQVTFVNADDVRHNLFSERVVTFDISQRPGATDRITFDVAGEVEVQCAIHPRMRLLVRVAR